MGEGSIPSREDLEAVRKEQGVGEGGPRRVFSLDDDLRHLQFALRLDLGPEDWARDHGLPVEYARALARHVRGHL